MPKKTTVTDNKKDFKSALVTQDLDRNTNTAYHVHTVQNIEPVLKHVKMLEENKPPKAWKKWLNNPDNKPFRTWKGKV